MEPGFRGRPGRPAAGARRRSRPAGRRSTRRDRSLLELPRAAARTLTVHWPSVMSMASAGWSRDLLRVCGGTSAERPGISRSEIAVSAATASSPLAGCTSRANDGRAVVGAGVEQCGRTPSRRVCDAQRGRGARRDPGQGARPDRAVQQHPVAGPAVRSGTTHGRPSTTCSGPTWFPAHPGRRPGRRGRSGRARGDGGSGQGSGS